MLEKSIFSLDVPLQMRKVIDKQCPVQVLTFDKKINMLGVANDGTFIRFDSPVTLEMDSDKNIRVK